MVLLGKNHLLEFVNTYKLSFTNLNLGNYNGLDSK